MYPIASVFKQYTVYKLMICSGLFLILFGFGCDTLNSLQESSTQGENEYKDDLGNTLSQKNNLEAYEREIPQTDSDMADLLPVSEENLPKDIHPAQVTKVFSTGFALVSFPSMNVYLPDIPSDFNPTFKGVLQWDSTLERWQKIWEVVDINSELSLQNNPVDLWWVGPDGTDQIPHLQVVDTNGAGSGEGIAKVLIPDNLGLDTWSVIECFYWAEDLGRQEEYPTDEDKCQAVSVRLVIDETN